MIYNGDMNVPEELLNQFPDLTRLLANPDIMEQFNGPEAVSKRSKTFFNVFGLSSLVFMILVLLIAICRFVLNVVEMTPPLYLLWISAILGILSLILSLSSHFVFGFRHKWFHNRFITERLRQWKFQQLLDGAFVGLSKTNPKEFEKELKARWAKAKFDLFDRPGTMHDFLNSEDFELFVRPSVCSHPDVARQIEEAYEHFRLNYQANYFSLKRELLRGLDVWTNSIAKFSLMVAGILALGEVILLLVSNVEHETTLSWIMGASALSAALISAAIRVVRSAMAISEETERYASKWVLLRILYARFRTEADHAKKLEWMIETERVCIEELREFIRTFNKSDYLL